MIVQHESAPSNRIDIDSTRPDARTREAWAKHAGALAGWTDKTLVNRRDAYGRYLPIEKRRGDQTAFTDKSGLTLAELQRHYTGRDVGDLIGLHAISRDEPGGDGQVAACWSRWLGIDIDRHDDATDPDATLKAALALYDRAVALGFRPLLFDSNGRGGFHLLLIFDGPVPSEKVYALGRWFVRDWKALGLDTDPETFPKQAGIGPGGFGNWLRLPGRHHTREHFTRAWDGSTWLDGTAAIKAIVGTKGSPTGSIPPEALLPPPKPSRSKARAAAGSASKDVEEAGLALAYLDPSMGYDEWLSVGMALSQLGRPGLDLWDRWSSSSEKYAEGICDRKWRSFGKSDGLKLGTLFHMAKARGFEFPKSARATVGTNGHRTNGKAESNGNATRPPDPPPESAPVPKDDRPSIEVSTDEFRINNQAISALAADPEVYCRGQFIVTVSRDSASNKLITRPPETPRITALVKASIRERLSENARWIKQRYNPGTKSYDLVPTHVPDWSTAAVEARGSWPCMRPLEGVVEAPVLRPDGSILDAPGYDEKTGLLYEPNCDFPPIPPRISRANATAAVGKLLEIVADFPFAPIRDEVRDTDDGGVGHRTAFLAGLLTPLARHAIAGPCPLFLVDANTSASGKSKLCDIVAILATGREAARTAFPESDEEMRKQILSIALEGDRMMLIDNVATGASLGGASLDAVLTACTVKGRILGRSQMSREVPIYTVWYATGNNIGLKGDMLRRVVSYRLESPEERPEERNDFRIKGELLDHVRKNRGELVAAALTILRGYVLAGRPEPDLTPMDYPAWCRVVRNAIHWATGTDPCVTRREMVADDPETNLMRGLIEGWAELPKGTTGLTAAEAVRHLTNPDFMDRFIPLRDVLMEWSNDGGIPSPKSIGRRLKMFKGRVLGGKTLKSNTVGNTQSWRIADANPKGFEGFKGSDRQTSRENSEQTKDNKKGSRSGQHTPQTPQTDEPDWTADPDFDWGPAY